MFIVPSIREFRKHSPILIKVKHFAELMKLLLMTGKRLLFPFFVDMDEKSCAVGKRSINHRGNRQRNF